MSDKYNGCFVCGKANPIGLKLDFEYPEKGMAHAEVSVSQLFEGYPGVVHGGILSTLMDEVMAKAVIASGKAAFTAKLNVSYRKPLPPHQKVQLRGWIELAKTRTIRTRATISSQDEVFAEAEAVFIVPPKES